MAFKPNLPAAALVLAGAVNAVLSTLYAAPAFLQEFGAAALARELALQLAVYFMVGCGLMLALHRQLAQPTQTLRRPGRFILMLAGASAVLSWLGWALKTSVERGTLRAWAQSLPDFAEGWLNIMLWGGLFSWLYLLYLQRRQDQLRLNAVLAARALLAHQLAQAELLAARAHIDPLMVAGVLRQVQARYAQAPQQGAALLEQLVEYLRLALNRSGRHAGSATAALQALHEACR
jgi:hypothetical protein